MNYLNKVILINSAGIPYREISLNGNIHFIGTQGTGKSTTQRAILFFYTADSRRSKLGIKPSQKSFIDFYFPFDNSFLVYEVKKGNDAFFIYVYKRSNALKYLFVEGVYDKNLFWEETTALNRKEVAHKTSLSERFHTRVIESTEEYKSILYGSNKQYRNFSIMQSNAYDNIPRTIANIFLNSGLDSNVIKKTMIASIADSPQEIELISHEKHLRDFKNAFDQLTVMGNNLSFAGRILNNYKQLKDDRELACNLAQNVVNAAYGTENALKLELEVAEQIKSELELHKNELESYEKQSGEKLQELNSQKAVIGNFLKKLEEKKNKYKRINIDDLLKEHHFEKEYILKKESLIAEKEILTANFRELEQKYNAIKTQAENTFNAAKNSIEQEYTSLYHQHQKVENSLRDESRKVIEELSGKYSLDNEQLNKESDSIKGQIHDNQIQLVELKHKVYFGNEISQIECELCQNNEKQAGLEKSQTELLQEIKKIEDNLKLDEREKDIEIKNIENKYKPEKLKLEDELNKLRKKISSFEGTIYNHLNKHEPDWHQTFGKICSEQFIFSDETYFKKEQEASQTILGYTFDLGNLKNPFKKPEQYQVQENELSNKLEILLAKWEKDQADLINKFEKKKSDQGGKIKKNKAEIDALRYQKETLAKKIQLLKTEYKNFQERIAKEKEKEEQFIREKIEVLTGKLENKNKEKEGLKLVFEKTKNEKINILNEKLKDNAREVSDLEQNKKNKLSETDLIYRNELDRIEGEKRKELSGSDLDTEKLKLIDGDLDEIKNRLKNIDDNKQNVHEYLSDEKEYFSKEQETIYNLQTIEKNIVDEEAKNKIIVDKKKMKINAKQQLLQEKKTFITEWTTEIKYYNDYTSSSLYNYYKELLKENIKPSKYRQINELISGLREQHDKNTVNEERLFTHVSNFCGKFPSDNLFGFPTQFESNVQKEEFIEQLKDYIETNRLETHRKEAQKKYSLMTARISSEYEDLYKYRRDIEKIIGKINQAFRSGEIFVGAVKNIELKISESNHSVIKTMKRIKEFSDENSHLQGEVNLFNASDQETANIKATQLLTDFYESITSYRQENISVEDSFDIQLRVVENDNDTGWLEKLSNVGSNGTEILVKAMINIMLLYVFIENATKRNEKEIFSLHCIIDEVGVLHDSNVRGLSEFANRKGIWLINGSPNANDANSYTHIYKFQKIIDNKTKIIKLLTNKELDHVSQTE
ncbi:MAG: ATP-binding protein [Bacteroidales bacterium]